MRHFSKRNFWSFVFAVVRFSPPSQETEAAKRKAKAKNNSPDPQELILNLLFAAERSDAAPSKSVSNRTQFEKTNPIFWVRK